MSYGTQCMQPCTLNSQQGICALFTNLSPAFYNHVELSDDGAFATQCSVGSLVGSSTTIDQATNTTHGYFWVPAVSSVYDSNTWKGVSSPYTDLGDAYAQM